MIASPRNPCAVALSRPPGSTSDRRGASMMALPFVLLWVAWFIYWRVSARNTKPNERVESRASRLSYSLPLIVGVVLMNGPISSTALRVLPAGLVPYALGLLLCVLGLGFTVWARVHLSTNWSDAVSHKQGH